MTKTHAMIIVAVGGLVAGAGIFTANAASSKAACEAKFMSMLDVCVPQCQADADDGKATDGCIRSCAEEKFGEPVPDC